MDKPAVELSQPAPTRWYKPDTAAGKLEALILAEGLPYIGDIEVRYKRLMRKDGEVRPGGLDMDPGERAYRTYCLKQLTKSGLDRVQAHEQARMDRFLVREEMEKIAKEPIQKTQFSLDQREYAIQFHNEHRPILERKFKGFTIPPYFIYDVEFDGMDYAHAADLAAYYPPWDLPLQMTRSRLSGEFR